MSLSHAKKLLGVRKVQRRVRNLGGRVRSLENRTELSRLQEGQKFVDGDITYAPHALKTCNDFDPRGTIAAGEVWYYPEVRSQVIDLVPKIGVGDAEHERQGATVQLIGWKIILNFTSVDINAYDKIRFWIVRWNTKPTGLFNVAGTAAPLLPRDLLRGVDTFAGGVIASTPHIPFTARRKPQIELQDEMQSDEELLAKMAAYDVILDKTISIPPTMQKKTVMFKHFFAKGKEPFPMWDDDNADWPADGAYQLWMWTQDKQGYTTTAHPVLDSWERICYWKN